MLTVMIWSSWRAPVPPMRILPPAARTCSMNSVADFAGLLALTQSTNWSSAIMDTGVNSVQSKVPVDSPVVNRFDSVMTILCGSPFAFLTSRKPSAPAPPPLLTTMIDCFIRLFFWMMPWMNRAIWSAPPPVPAGTMNSTVRVGSQAWANAGPPATASAAAEDSAVNQLRRD